MNGIRVLLRGDDSRLYQLKGCDRLFGEYRQHDRQAVSNQGDNHVQMEFQVVLQFIDPTLKRLAEVHFAAGDVFLPVEVFADGLADELGLGDLFVLLVDQLLKPRPQLRCHRDTTSNGLSCSHGKALLVILAPSFVYRQI